LAKGVADMDSSWLQRLLAPRRLVPRALGLSLALAAAYVPSTAVAGEPSVWSGRTVTLTWTPLPTSVPLAGGEPTGDAFTLPPSIAVLPLRLSLLAATFPEVLKWGIDPCGSNMDPAASAVPFFPMNRSAFLPLTPRLVLHAFSSGHCIADSGGGGGVTYTAPVAKNWWLTGSAGMYAVQAFRPNQPQSMTARGDARVDLTYRPAPDRAWALGLGRRGLTIGGIW
jgi:hypothetical protein